MPNPNPSPDTRFEPMSEEALSRKIAGAKLPESAQRILDTLPDKSAKIRQWILEGMKREGLLPES
jgi:hypothetical protein